LRTNVRAIADNRRSAADLVDQIVADARALILVK
jgi:hypothetical protein